MNQPGAIGKDHFLQLSKAGSRLNLSFSGYEVLNKSIMALDGVNRKLLLLPCHDPTAEPVIIPLGKVLNISVKKIYAGIPAGGLKSKALEAFINNILLEFEMADNQSTIVVSVYDATLNQTADRAKLEKKARNWQQLLMKLSGTNKRKTKDKVVVLADSNNTNNHLSTVH